MKTERRRVERQFLCSSPSEFPEISQINRALRGLNFIDLKNPILLEVGGAEHKHLALSLRLRVSDQINLLDKFNNIKLHAEIVEITKEKTTVRCSSFSYYHGIPITALIGISDPKTLDFICEKLCELGLHSIVYFQGEHSTQKGSDKAVNLERLERIRDSAVKQSNSYIYTHLGLASNLQSCASTVDAETLRIALVPPSPGGEWTSLTALLEQNKNAKKIIMAIGPEGGFSNNELNILAKENYLIAGLANNTLRVETAAILGCGITVQQFHNS